MKWVVFWIVVNINQAPCKQPGPFTDEFGIVHNDYVTTTQACFSSDRKNMSKEFDTLEAAQAFVARAMKECGDTSGLQIYTRSTCDQFEIKELRTIGGK